MKPFLVFLSLLVFTQSYAADNNYSLAEAIDYAESLEFLDNEILDVDSPANDSFQGSYDNSQSFKMMDAVYTDTRENLFFNANNTTSDNKFGKGLSKSFKARGANCNAFINEKNDLGRHGIAIKNAFSKYTKPGHIGLLLNDSAAKAHSMPQLCPKFKSLSNEERIRFWVWTMAAIAWEESTCKDNAYNPNGTTDAAVGLLQLNRNYKNRYWRGALCKAKEVATPPNNLSCGLEIMRGQFDGFYGKPAGLSMPKSYWQRLRQGWSKIDYLISLYPGCA
jgi:hypothetical protein